jgi:hypothetical protein
MWEEINMTQQKMHINQKIMEEIHDTLPRKYSIYNINPDDWELFKKPLIMNNGKIDRAAFEKRQKKSIDIIKKILAFHGKGDIVDVLKNLASIEPKIQELQPWVRDHVVHAINTFILGAYILKKVEFPRIEGARFGYPFMWKLCGPTHDLGYPIEIAHNIKSAFVDNMNNILNDLHSPSPRVEPELFPQNFDKLCEEPDANEIIQKRLTDWELGIDVEDFYGWLKKKNRTDHGVVSALAQLKVMDALYYHVNPNREYRDINLNGLNFNQQNFDVDIVNACSALFIHNIDLDYDGFSDKISFDIAPLAFLLFLCDTFQEYDRYSEKIAEKEEEESVYSGDDFNIVCTHNSISLSVPKNLERKVYNSLSKRLSGLMVTVNGEIAVNRSAVPEPNSMV